MISKIDRESDRLANKIERKTYRNNKLDRDTTDMTN